MLSLLVGAGSILVACYAAFCWGAEWARNGSERRARVDHDEAMRLRALASEALQLHELEVGVDDRQHRDLLARLRRQEENVLRRAGAASHAWFESSNWEGFAPWVEHLSWKQRLEELRDWAKRRQRST